MQGPQKIVVGKVIKSRYPDNLRPDSWDLRKEGEDTIETQDGQVLTLMSDGGQEVPQPGWVLMLRSGHESSTGNLWTLYGIPENGRA